ncbi:MazG family protein [Mycetocola zhadangensis]|uniref:Nucleoside triphosphate pyrophosphohydrolase n=1 Tax=Mycetocola zhadangensis TaxID=1164595 RepID=A0A3L7J856_9MICO|nr:MazG family protein [Mycetocola zhadangensis]RLQ85631.1 nucleoside triphosphate pyrophosphohydrolase [Mycetocola zhadangensis]
MDALATSMSTVLDTCVWSKTMTHESLITYLVEESYELIDAVEAGDRDALLEELGDVLLQVVFHSEIARRTSGEEFSLDDVARAANEKMIRRHPHVFGNDVALTVDDVYRVWRAAKAREKATRTSILEGIPQAMPALALADKVLGRATQAGLDIFQTDAVKPPVFEDEAQLGALLLSIAASANEQGLDAERALRSALRDVQETLRAAENEAGAGAGTQEPSVH